MTVEQTQHSPQDIVALQEASATRALGALAKALQEGKLVKNNEAKREPFEPHTTR